MSDGHETRAGFIESGKGDCTARPIFLLQARTIMLTGDRWEYCSEGERFFDSHDFEDQDTEHEDYCSACQRIEHLSPLEILQKEAGDPDIHPNKLPDSTDSTESIWESSYVNGEAVWSNRADATRMAEATAYNRPTGWRVYCVPASEELDRIMARGWEVETAQEEANRQHLQKAEDALTTVRQHLASSRQMVRETDRQNIRLRKEIQRLKGEKR